MLSNNRNPPNLLVGRFNNQIDNLLKICSKCGQEKDVAEFWKAKRAKDGLFCSCKSCAKEVKSQNKERLFQEHKKYQLENPINEKTCYCCKQKKLVVEFNKNKSTKDGFDGSCKICHNEYNKQDYFKNKERLFQEYKKYQLENLVERKTCTKCEKEKDICEFWKNKYSKDGFYCQCRNCAKEVKNKNKERLFQEHIKFQLENPINEKKCFACKKIKNVNEFDECKEKKDGFSMWCKTCRSQHVKQDRLNNPDKVRKSARKYAKKRRSTPIVNLNARMSCGVRTSLIDGKSGRHWEYLVGYTLEELKVSLEATFTPYMCWANISEMQVDHDFPKSRLIFDSAEDPTFLYLWSLGNLKMLWKADNNLKGDMTPWEWAEFKKEHPERLFDPEKFYKDKKIVSETPVGLSTTEK